MKALAAPAPESTCWIDSHVHVWTPDLEKYPLASDYQVADMVPPSFTPQQLLEHATKANICRITLIQMSFYGFDNNYMLDVIAADPDRFSGVAVIDDRQPKLAEEMLALAKRGVRGFRLNLRDGDANRWFSGDGQKTMWRVGGEKRLAMGLLTNADALEAIDRRCAAYPDTPVVIDHLARIGVDGEIRDRDVKALCRLARHSQAHVKVSAFYALGAKKAPYLDLGPFIKRVYEAFGPSRLMWGSDCPYQVVDGYQYADSVELIRSGLDFLSDDDRAWLLEKTADRVFFHKENLT